MLSEVLVIVSIILSFSVFNHDANIKVISDIVTGKWSISISTNRDRLILIYNPNNQYITLNFIESHFIK